MRTHEEKLNSAMEALDGLSVGDALGEALSYQFYRVREAIDFSAFRDHSVRYTDDTEMAIAVYETLVRCRTIDPEILAWAFSSRFRRDPQRGYGKGTRRILTELAAGQPWEPISKNTFGGGSFGNGAAMRVAPLGAYFADEIEAIPEIAANSARVTHYHPEGIAGAIAVAVCAAAAFRSRGFSEDAAREAIWGAALDLTPGCEVRKRLSMAREMASGDPAGVSRMVGNGAEISAQDTVPFCVWNACRCIGDYREAVISTIGVGGDCDTNSAIVGGIVASFTGSAAIPAEWMMVREKLDIRI